MSHRLKLLIDECLHTSLVRTANDHDCEAHHVAYLGMSGLKDHQLMPIIRERDFTFVTNNAVDFRRLFQTEPIHAGLVIIVPSVTPQLQRALLAAPLEYVGDCDLINRVVEISLDGQNTLIQEYEIPAASP